jgi:hypothetical protein
MSKGRISGSRRFLTLASQRTNVTAVARTARRTSVAR